MHRLQMVKYGRTAGIAIVLLAAAYILTTWTGHEATREPTVSTQLEGGASVNVTPSNSGHSRAAASSVPEPPRERWAARASSESAQFNRERSGFAWLLPQFGADSILLDRVARDDPFALMSELFEKARAGDRVATNVIGWLAYQRCYLGRTEEQIAGWGEMQRLDARALAPDDATWFVDVLAGGERRELLFLKACNRLGGIVEKSRALVVARAAQGDPASLWLMSRIDATEPESAEFLRRSAQSGFPQALYEWLDAVNDGRASSTSLDQRRGIEPALRDAATEMPQGKARLAACYFNGCLGTSDPDAAVALARDAARQGQVDALLYIGRRTASGYLDPTEVEAWRLFSVELRLRGCLTSDFSVEWMRQLNADMDRAQNNPAAVSQAAELWTRYGAAALSKQGCTG